MSTAVQSAGAGATPEFAGIAVLQPNAEEAAAASAEAEAAPTSGAAPGAVSPGAAAPAAEESFASAQPTQSNPQGSPGQAAGGQPRHRMTWQTSANRQSRSASVGAFNYYPELPPTYEELRHGPDQTRRFASMTADRRAVEGFDAAKSGARVYTMTYGEHLPSAPYDPNAWADDWDDQGVPPGREGMNAYNDSAMHGGVPGGKPQPSPPPGSVVHMSRADAWSRFAAYEACIQVCCLTPSLEFAQHFMTGGFQPLRDNLRIGSLLLPATPPAASLRASAGGSPPGVPDICWQDDTASGDAIRFMMMPSGAGGGGGAGGGLGGRTASGGLYGPGSYGARSDTVIRVRVGGVILPGLNMLERLRRWAVKHQPAQGPRKVARRQKKLVVYLTCSDGTPMLQAPVDVHGCPIIQGPSSWAHMDGVLGELKIDVHAREGLVAQGSVTADALIALARTVEIQDTPRPDVSLGAGGESPEAVPSVSRVTATTHAQLGATGTGLPAGQLIIEVQRVRRSVLEEEEAAQLLLNPNGVAGLGDSLSGPVPRPMGSPAAELSRTGQPMVRLNRNVAYDVLLHAALEVERCGPTRVTIEGPWQWLLTAYADHFQVSNPYRVLVHLQWLLQPRIARTSALCLSTISNSWRYLLGCKLKGELTPHEDTLLTRIRRDVEELLKVAFTRYYVPQGEEDGGDDPPKPYELQTWDAQHLQAAVQLYEEVKSFLKPNAHDWLAACWTTAAKKRWRALMAIGDADRLLANELAAEGLEAAAGIGPPTSSGGWRGPANSNRQRAAVNGGGMRAAGDVKVYQLVMALCKLIQEDITFDLHLKREPELLPLEPELPRKTAEEYLACFLVILRLVLDTHPPAAPTPIAVDLLVAVASMQRYLDVAGLQCDKEHPGHLNAFQLFQPHVLRWIAASQARLIAQCNQLEAATKGPNAPAVALGPGNSCPLVVTMMHSVAKELRCYERVLQHWPRFAPPLEAAVCQVLRCVLGALSRQCELVKGNAAALDRASGAAAAPGHQRSATVAAIGGRSNSPQKLSSAWGFGHRRNASAASPPGATGSGAEGGGGTAPDVGPLTARAPGGGKGGSGLLSPRGDAPYASDAKANVLRAMLGGGVGLNSTSPAAPTVPPRMVVLMKEAVLLNSLKHIMVLVPELEENLTAWATWAAGQAPATSDGQMLPDGVDIGVHFAQLVKELRTDYATAVATAAGRLADALRGCRATNIREALRPRPPVNSPGKAGAGPTKTTVSPNRPGEVPVAGYGLVSNATAQRAALEEALAPVLAGLKDALEALQASLDTRVAVATGRALWDYMGKDMHLLVSSLQETSAEGMDSESSAWRVRQNADAATHRIDELFCNAFTEMLSGAVQPCDLQAPAHMDKVHKLLQRNNAAINLAFTPF